LPSARAYTDLMRQIISPYVRNILILELMNGWIYTFRKCNSFCAFQMFRSGIALETTVPNHQEAPQIRALKFSRVSTEEIH